MPILNPGDAAPPVPTPVPVQITEPAFRGVTVDTREQPVNSLLTHVEGSSWTVDYYSQIVDKDNDIGGQQVTRNKVFQQYTLIKSLELKVTQALTSSQDAETKAFHTLGVANMYPGVTPNTGDMFIADVGDGREAVFEITNSTRMSMLKKAVYNIEYNLVDYSDVRGADLDNKVVKTVYFSRDYAINGLQPLIEEEDYVIISKLAERYHDTQRDYFKSFFSKEYGTLIVPGQIQPVYDAFLIRALTQMFNTREAPEFLKMREFNTSGDNIMKTDTLWDALLQREQRIVEYCAQEAGLVGIGNFTSQGMMEGIYYSGIKYVVYPKNPTLGVDDALKNKIPVLSGWPLQPSPLMLKKNVRITALAGFDVAWMPVTQLDGFNWVDPTLPTTPLDGLSPVDPVLYKPVTVDDYYILSESFYLDTTGKSALEVLVWHYLTGKALDNRWLLALIEGYRGMEIVEKFYYTPIILLLIKASLRAI